MTQESNNKPRAPGDILGETVDTSERLIQTKYRTKQPQDKQEARHDAVVYAALQVARLKFKAYVQERKDFLQMAKVWDDALDASEQHDWTPLKQMLQQTHVQTKSPAFQHLSDLLEPNQPENHTKGRKSSTPRELIDLNNENLTPLELEIMELVLAGKSNEEIARSLYLSQPTVSHYFLSAAKKLGFPKKKKQ